MVKISDLTHSRSGTIELQVGESEADTLVFYWHEPKGLKWTEAQFKAKDDGDVVKVFRDILIECVDYVEDEEGKHKFTAKIFDNLGFVADVLMSAFVEELEPSFREFKRRSRSDDRGDAGNS